MIRLIELNVSKWYALKMVPPQFNQGFTEQALICSLHSVHPLCVLHIKLGHVETCLVPKLTLQSII